MNADQRKPGVCDLSLLATGEPSAPTLTQATVPGAAERHAQLKLRRS